MTTSLSQERKSMIETVQSQAHIANSDVGIDAIRVLLIDDNEDDAMIAQAMLTRVRGITFNVDWVSTF